MSGETIGFAPSENPYVVEHGGFYRRWLSMIDDIEELKSWVSKVSSTYQEVWVPNWRKAGQKYEKLGEEAQERKDYISAKKQFLTARTYYSIG